MKPNSNVIDQYLAAASSEDRRVLEKLCGTIRAAVPGAEECISYGLPTFKQDGRPLMAFGAWAKHCALYPMSGRAVAALGDALDGFSTSKGTIRFTADKPLPAAIVKKLLKARLAEIAAKPKRGAKKAAAPKATPSMSAKKPVEKPAAKTTRATAAKTGAASKTEQSPAEIGKQCGDVIATLKRMGTKKTRDGMARFGIPADKAFGVPVGELQKLAKKLGKSHELASALWESGWYEARMLAAFVDEAEKVTPAQMDRWCGDFDSWAICDTVCFHLFDRTPHAWKKIPQWAKRSDEFGKRTAFALLASLAGHDKTTGNGPFADCLPIIERAATDERNFVKKGVSWALRMIGRRNAELYAASMTLAERLAASDVPAARWIGKDAVKDLNSPAVARRMSGKGTKSTKR